MSARALAVLDRFPLHLAATDPEKRFEHVVRSMTDSLEVLTRQVADVRRSHRLSEAPTSGDLRSLGGLHGLREQVWALILARLEALQAAANAEPIDPAAVASLVGLTEEQIGSFGEEFLAVVASRPVRHRPSLEMRRKVVRGTIAAHTVGNATPAALLTAAAAYLGLDVQEVAHTDERWWHLVTCHDQIRLEPGPGEVLELEPDLLALEENPFRDADLDPAPKKHGQLFQVIRGGLENVDVTVRVLGVAGRTVRPMVVSTFAGHGLAFEGSVAEGSELRFEASGRVTLDGAEVTGSAWSFQGAVFASSTATRPARDFLFAGRPQDGDRQARFVETAPLADALDVSASFPHGAPGVGPLRLPLGESRWVGFVRVSHTSTAIPGVVAPRNKHALFDNAVFGDDETAAGVTTGGASMNLGFEWEEREPFAVRVLLPRRLQAADDEAGSRIRQPLRQLLDRHRAAGVDVRVEYADPRWTLGTGVVRDAADEPLGTVLSGTELWPDGTPQPGPG
jgi:hypothetical protein